MSSQGAASLRPIPARAGIGLRPLHFMEVLETRPPLPWFELHSENFFVAGGPLRDTLLRVAENYPLSLHGVGLSLGSAEPLNAGHLRQLQALVERVQPGLVSDHLCWGHIAGVHWNNLLPLPFTEEAVAICARHIRQIQDVLGREFVVENVSSYFTCEHDAMPEWEFVAAVVREAGCGLLLDVNNVYVNSVNHSFDPQRYIEHMPAAAVREVHLAGYTEKLGLDASLLIDSHSCPVADVVWDLYAFTLQRIGPRPTLIEWDQDIPELHVLASEAARAQEYLDVCHARAA